MIGKFGAAKDQWFSSFLLQVENHSSWHRLFVDPLSRAMYSSDGPDFEFVQQKRKEGLSIHEAVSTYNCKGLPHKITTVHVIKRQSAALQGAMYLLNTCLYLL